MGYELTMQTFNIEHPVLFFFIELFEYLIDKTIVTIFILCFFRICWIIGKILIAGNKIEQMNKYKLETQMIFLGMIIEITFKVGIELVFGEYM